VFFLVEADNDIIIISSCCKPH